MLQIVSLITRGEPLGFELSPDPDTCLPIPTLRLKRRWFVGFRTDGLELAFKPVGTFHVRFGGWLAKMDRVFIIDTSRDKYGARCKQQAFDYLDRGDVRNAVTLFVNDLNAPDRIANCHTTWQCLAFLC